MLRDAQRCSIDDQRCSEMLNKCSKMLRDAQKMLRDAQRCSEMLRNGQRCSKDAQSVFPIPNGWDETRHNRIIKRRPDNSISDCDIVVLLLLDSRPHDRR